METNKTTNKYRNNQGQIIIITSLFLLAISLVFFSIITSPVVQQIKNNRNIKESKKSFFTTESSNEDVFYRIKKNMQVSSQESLSLNSGVAVSEITDLGNSSKEVVSVGNVKDRVRKIKNIISSASGTSFNYGLFSGQGGIYIGNNAVIQGSVYSNGKIIGSGNSYIEGDVYIAVQAATSTSKEWIVYNNDFIFGRYVGGERPVDIAQSFDVSLDDTSLNKIALYLKKVGSPANIDIKITKDKFNEPNKNDIIASGTINASLVEEEYSFIEVGLNNNPELESGQKYWIVADLNRDDSNYYVLGYDNTNNYPNNKGLFSLNWTAGGFNDAGGDFNFKIWANDSNEGGLLDNVLVQNTSGSLFSAYAHTIENSDVSGNVTANSFTNGNVGGDIVASNVSNCTISGNAIYSSSDNCSILGTENSPAPQFVSPPFLPPLISQANIDFWKNDAISGGVISVGNYSPNNEEIIGPGVIEGNLNINLGRTVYLRGNVYVKGSITMGNNSSLKLSSDYQFVNSSATLITDKWFDSGTGVSINEDRVGGNHLMILSLAICDQIWGMSGCSGDEASIYVKNNTKADVLAAPYGTIKMQENTSAASLYGSRLYLENNLRLIYEQGLTNMNFSSGPGGTWTINSWEEVE